VQNRKQRLSKSPFHQIITGKILLGASLQKLRQGDAAPIDGIRFGGMKNQGSGEAGSGNVHRQETAHLFDLGETLNLCRCYARSAAKDRNFGSMFTLALGVTSQPGFIRTHDAQYAALYSITTSQAAILALFRVVNRYVGNSQPMPGVFPDDPAPRDP
jgi:hypothetical protein